MESVIKWQTGEPKEECEYLVTFEYKDGHAEVCVTSWSAIMKGFRTNKDNIRYTLAWCKLSDITPYKEETK